MLNNQERRNLFIKNRKIAEVFFKLENIKNFDNNSDFIESLVKKCSNQLQVIGFEDLREFKDFLNFVVFGAEKFIPRDCLEINKKIVSNIITKVLHRCISLFDKEIIKIFVFPTFNNFVVEKMNGVCGFCTNKNVILLTLAPVGKWRLSLESAVAHELAHALSPYYDMSKISIGEGLIFDGIAEHLREHFIDGEKAIWVKKFSKQEAIKFFNKLKPYLEVRDIDFYKEVFFGAGKYPLWVGYAAGYYLVGAYLKNKKPVNWKEIIKADPKKILDEIK